MSPVSFLLQYMPPLTIDSKYAGMVTIPLMVQEAVTKVLGMQGDVRLKHLF
jgi:hypothetical protein